MPRSTLPDLSSDLGRIRTAIPHTSHSAIVVALPHPGCPSGPYPAEMLSYFRSTALTQGAAVALGPASAPAPRDAWGSRVSNPVQLRDPPPGCLDQGGDNALWESLKARSPARLGILPRAGVCGTARVVDRPPRWRQGVELDRTPPSGADGTRTRTPAALPRDYWAHPTGPGLPTPLSYRPIESRVGVEPTTTGL